MIKDWAPCRNVQCISSESEREGELLCYLGVPRPQQRQPGIGGHNAANHPASGGELHFQERECGAESRWRGLPVSLIPQALVSTKELSELSA